MRRRGGVSNGAKLSAIFGDLLWDSWVRAIRDFHRPLRRSFGLVEKGNTVAILSGSNKPLILRSDEKGTWRCIGSAYVSGIMKGEAWHPDTPVEELETFKLT